MFCGDACSWRAGSKDLDQTRSDEKHSTRAPWSNDRSTSILTGRAVRTIDYRWFLQDGALLVCPHNARRLLMLLLIWCGLVCSHVVVDAEEHWFLQDLLRFSLHWSNGQPNEGGPAPSRCNCKNSWLSSVLTARPVRTLAQQEFLQVDEQEFLWASARSGGPDRMRTARMSTYPIDNLVCGLC